MGYIDAPNSSCSVSDPIRPVSLAQADGKSAVLGPPVDVDLMSIAGDLLRAVVKIRCVGFAKVRIGEGGTFGVAHHHSVKPEVHRVEPAGDPPREDA